MVFSRKSMLCRTVGNLKLKVVLLQEAYDEPSLINVEESE